VGHAGDTARNKPGTLLLLRHIVRATLSDGMLWPVLLCTAVIAALCHFDVAYHDSLSIMIITGIVVTGLLRGCNAWQAELNDYQQRLATARHRQQDEVKRHAIPGYYPSRRY
jgi:hypothetical protein